MKPFESFLSPQLNEFLTYRETLGYTMRRRRSHLIAFDRYLKDTDANWNSFEPSFFLRMRADLGKEPRHTNQILIITRVFFQFLLRRGYLEENPLQDVPLLKEKFFLSDLAMYLAILLLARCGMRISEPLRLMRQHYRRDDGTLYIEKTKFKKDRLIPAPIAIITEIDNYLAVRRHLQLDDHNPYLLAGKKEKPLSEYQVRSTFHQAVKNIGLQQQRRVMGNMTFNPPVPHSLRHSFAINTLRKIIERGDSAQDALPVLAVYLGHSTYFCSSVYLKITDAKSRNDLYDFTVWQKWKI